MKNIKTIYGFLVIFSLVATKNVYAGEQKVSDDTNDHTPVCCDNKSHRQLDEYGFDEADYEHYIATACAQQPQKPSSMKDYFFSMVQNVGINLYIYWIIAKLTIEDYVDRIKDYMTKWNSSRVKQEESSIPTNSSQEIQ